MTQIYNNYQQSAPSFAPKLRVAQNSGPAGSKVQTVIGETVTAPASLITPEELAALPPAIQDEIKTILGEITILTDVKSVIVMRDGVKECTTYLLANFTPQSTEFQQKYRAALIREALGHRARNTDANFAKAQQLAERNESLASKADDAAVEQMPDAIKEEMEKKFDEGVAAIPSHFANEQTFPHTQRLYWGHGIKPAYDGLLHLTDELEKKTLDKLKTLAGGDLAVKLLAQNNPGFDPAAPDAFSKLTQAGVAKVIKILSDRIFALKQNNFRIDAITPAQLVPGQKFRLEVAGQGLDQVKDVKMPDVKGLKGLPRPQYDNGKLTFKETVIRENAKPCLYKVVLLGENDKELGSFDLTVMKLGEKRFPVKVQRLHIEAGAGFGVHNSVPDAVKAETQNSLPNWHLRLGLAPKIIGSDGLVLKGDLRLGASAYADLAEARKSAGAGINGGYNLFDLRLNYDFNKFGYSAPNMQFFNGSQQLLTARAGVRHSYNGWLTGDLGWSFISDGRNYDRSTFGLSYYKDTLPTAARDQRAVLDLTVEADLHERTQKAGAPRLTLSLGAVTGGYHVGPEADPAAVGSSRYTVGGHKGELRADWIGVPRWFPYAAVGYSVDKLDTFLSNENIYAKIGTGKYARLGAFDFEAGRDNRNHYYPVERSFYARLRWTDPKLQVFSLSAGYSRFNNQATNDNFNLFDASLMVDVYRATELTAGTRQVLPPDSSCK
jgi:hypothetical protein